MYYVCRIALLLFLKDKKYRGFHLKVSINKVLKLSSTKISNKSIRVDYFNNSFLNNITNNKHKSIDIGKYTHYLNKIKIGTRKK